VSENATGRRPVIGRGLQSRARATMRPRYVLTPWEETDHRPPAGEDHYLNG